MILNYLPSKKKSEMTQREILVKQFLEAVRSDLANDNTEAIAELCEWLIKDAKVKTLKDLKEYFIGDEE